MADIGSAIAKAMAAQQPASSLPPHASDPEKEPFKKHEEVVILETVDDDGQQIAAGAQCKVLKTMHARGRWWLRLSTVDGGQVFRARAEAVAYPEGAPRLWL